MHLKEIGENVKNWLDSAVDRNYWRALVNSEFNHHVPQTMELINFVFLSGAETSIFRVHLLFFILFYFFL